MAKLPSLLQQVPNIQHAICADDITIWATKGSDGTIQDALQEAVSVVQDYAAAGSLTCSVDKSELLVYKRRRKTADSPDISLFLDGHPIPLVPRIRILGLYLQSDGKASYTTHLLAQQITQITHMIQRITNRRRGLCEKNVLRLVQALIVSRLTYHLPFHNLRLAQIKKIDILL
uniref:Putative tick transposon n=1 Tax=Rhipicephalus microplus TaxID=6941 RepID=A0A6G5ACL6_RHIMP